MSDRDFELAEIYDDTDATVFRMGDQAVTIMANRGACVIRPWHWRPIDKKRYPAASSTMTEGIQAMMEAPEEWSGIVTLGELLVWSSRRTRRDELHPPQWGDDQSMFLITRADVDAQRVGSRIFNRRLIREAAQAFVEHWAEGEAFEPVRCAIKALPNGATLCLSAFGIRAFVMCLSNTTDAGDERMPVAKCACDEVAGKTLCMVHGPVSKLMDFDPYCLGFFAHRPGNDQHFVWHPDHEESIA